MTTIEKKFGKKVKMLRVERDMTQEDLAYAAELDRSYISSIERGERSVKLSTIEKLAKALEVEIGLLFQYKQESFSTIQKAK